MISAIVKDVQGANLNSGNMKSPIPDIIVDNDSAGSKVLLKPSPAVDIDNIDELPEPEPEIILDSLQCASPCNPYLGTNLQLDAPDGAVPAEEECNKDDGPLLDNKQQIKESEQNVSLTLQQKGSPATLQIAESAILQKTSPGAQSSPIAPTILVTADDEDSEPIKEEPNRGLAFPPEVFGEMEENAEEYHFNPCRELIPSCSPEIIPVSPKEFVPWEDHRDFNPWSLDVEVDAPVVYTPPDCDEMTGLRFQEEAVHSHARADGIPHGRNGKSHFHASPWGEEDYVSYDIVSYSHNTHHVHHEDDNHLSHTPSTPPEHNLEVYKLPTLLEHMQGDTVMVSKPNHVGQEVDEYKINSESLASEREFSSHSNDHAVCIVGSAAFHAQTTFRDLVRSSDGLLADSEEAAAAEEEFLLSDHHSAAHNKAVVEHTVCSAVESAPVISDNNILQVDPKVQQLDFREPSVLLPCIEKFVTEDVAAERLNENDCAEIDKLIESQSNGNKADFYASNEKRKQDERINTQSCSIDGFEMNEKFNVIDSASCEEQKLDEIETPQPQDILEKETKTGPDKVAAENLRVGEANSNDSAVNENREKDTIYFRQHHLEEIENAKQFCKTSENGIIPAEEQITEASVEHTNVKPDNVCSEGEGHLKDVLMELDYEGLEILSSRSDESVSWLEVHSPRNDDDGSTVNGVVLKPKPPPGRPMDRRCNTAR